MTSHETNEAGDVRGSLRDLLARALGRHGAESSDEQRVDGVWTWGIVCECEAFAPDHLAHVAAEVAKVVDGWLSEQRSRIDFIRTPLDNLDEMPPSLAFHAGIKAAADILDAALAAIREQIGAVR